MKHVSYFLIYCLAFASNASGLAPPPPPPPPQRSQSFLSSSKRTAFGSSRSILGRENSDNSNSYIRWKKDGDLWKMQTSVTTFQRGNQTVELHAQIHYGDANYFQFYNDPEFQRKHHSVHYELLVDQQLLHYQDGNWRVKHSIMASPNDQLLARQYGWTCQIDSIDYTKSNWIHADLTRQEFIKLVQKSDSFDKNSQKPLWQLASNVQSSSATAEAMSALLVGPPTLSYSTRILQRRLFTNLFLPGNALANQLRALLWMTVPAPELSILLLDWSSLLEGGSNPNALSEVALPIINSFLKLNLSSMRRFLFGQVLVSSATPKHVSDSWSILVTKRNDYALSVLEQSLEDSTEPFYSTALLYGSSHCPDLHQKLVSKGFRPTGTQWRTAWSVQEHPETNLPALLIISLVIYLAVGAFDWIGMMGDVAENVQKADYLDATAVAIFYLIRHVLLYMGLSKFLVDWNKQQ